jgi:hypothetical protein
MQIIRPVMDLYTETTDGSIIEQRDTVLVWNYEDADPDFGSCQAKELVDHLESVVTNEPVSVKSTVHSVEAKPQVKSLILLSSPQFLCANQVSLLTEFLSKLTGCEQRPGSTTHAGDTEGEGHAP